MTESLKERLEHIASTPRTGRPVPDVAAAAARGRRVLRVRRAGAGVGTALAVGLVAGAVVGLPGGEKDSPVVPLAGPPRPSPLTQRADFGWLPPGYKTVSVGVDVDGQVTIGASDQMGKGEGISLTLVEGKEPGVAKLPGGRPGNRTAAPDVKGHKAFWTIKPGGPGSDQVPAEFRWQPDSGRWALLSVIDEKVASEATIYRIARAVTFKESPGVFPFTVKGVPASLKSSSATVNKGDGDYALTLSRDCARQGLNLDVSKAQPLASYERQTTVGGKGKAFPFKPNTTIDGHPAYDQSLVKADAKGSFIRVFGVEGYDVRIDASAEVLNELRSTGGLKGLFHRMTFLDSGHWTTEVLR